MNTQTTITTVAALFVGILVGVYAVGPYAGPNRSSDNHFNQDGHMHAHTDATESSMSGGMNGSGIMGDGPGMMSDMSVESEEEFILNMIPHHQEAVNTAQEVLERGGTTEEVRSLAENIISAQEKEIADMKEWYKQWYGQEYKPTGEYEPMMRELEGLSGAELDRVFLTDMIPHHMGAIMMARSVQPVAEHEEVSDLAEGIISSQRKEIFQMRSMLANMQ